jgi:YVTN family beta-propeller protein
VSIVDTTTGGVNTITVGNFPSDVVFSSDREHAYVTNQTGNRVTIIDVASDTLLDTIAVGARRIGVAVNTDETRLYAANNQAGTVSVVDLTDIAIAGTSGIASHDNWLYVIGVNSDTLTVIDTTTNGVVDTFPVGRLTWKSAPTATTSTSPTAAAPQHQ